MGGGSEGEGGREGGRRNPYLPRKGKVCVSGLLLAGALYPACPALTCAARGRAFLQLFLQKQIIRCRPVSTHTRPFIGKMQCLHPPATPSPPPPPSPLSAIPQVCGNVPFLRYLIAPCCTASFFAPLPPLPYVSSTPLPLFSRLLFLFPPPTNCVVLTFLLGSLLLFFPSS